MRYLLFLLLLITVQAKANIIIVQSHVASEIFGNSVGYEVKRLIPEQDVTVLQVRDFDRDQNFLSKEYVEREIKNLEEQYGNLIIVGSDLLGVDTPNQIPLYLDSNTQGPASLTQNVEVVRQIRSRVSGLSSDIHVISDNTEISNLRQRQLEDYVQGDRSVSVNYYTVRNLSDFRKVLIDLNDYKFSRGFIFNNVFSIYDQDSMRNIDHLDAERIISNVNTRHVDISTLHDNLNASIGVGILANRLANKIVAIASTDERDLYLYPRVGVNIDRTRERNMDLNRFIFSNDSDIFIRSSNGN